MNKYTSSKVSAADSNWCCLNSLKTKMHIKHWLDVAWTCRKRLTVKNGERMKWTSEWKMFGSLAECLVFGVKVQITTHTEVRDSDSWGSKPQKGNRFVSISLCPRESNHFPLIWLPGWKQLKSLELPIIPHSTERLPFLLTCLGAAEFLLWYEICAVWNTWVFPQQDDRW